MAKDKLFVLTDNLTVYNRAVLCASEFFGTAILVILGCTGCVTFGKEASHLSISLCFGFAVMLGIQCVAHISGGHINPIVTISAAVLGHLPLIEVPIYFVGQMLGALVGFGALKFATPQQFVKNDESVLGVCSPGVSNNISPFEGFLSEFFSSLLLVLLCCSVWDPRNSTKHDSVAIKFGLAVAGLAVAFGPYSGANMNPARSFAPALWNGDWNNHWVYWLGPILAAVIGAGVYRFLFAIKPQQEEKNNTTEAIPLNDKP